MKRQRGRNRGGSTGGGGGGGGQGGQGGGKPQHNVNRAFDSNGPDGVKIRGHAQHVFEKYQQLARDASAAGDRVLGENYLQHAEHYFRLIRAVQPQRPASDIIGRDSFSSGYDIDFEDESNNVISAEADAAESERESAAVEAEANGEPRQERPEWRDRPERQERTDNNNRPREDRPREERNFNRDSQSGQGQSNQGQGERRRDEQPRAERS